MLNCRKGSLPLFHRFFLLLNCSAEVSTSELIAQLKPTAGCSQSITWFCLISLAWCKYIGCVTQLTATVGNKVSVNNSCKISLCLLKYRVFNWKMYEMNNRLEVKGCVKICVLESRWRFKSHMSVSTKTGFQQKPIWDRSTAAVAVIIQ